MDVCNRGDLEFAKASRPINPIPSRLSLWRLQWCLSCLAVVCDCSSTAYVVVGLKLASTKAKSGFPWSALAPQGACYLPSEVHTHSKVEVEGGGFRQVCFAFAGPQKALFPTLVNS